MFSSISRALLLSGRELAALTLLFALSLPAVTPRLYSSDEVQYYSYLRSLWFDGDVSFENEYRYFDEHSFAHTAGFRETFLERLTPAERRINFATIGCAILWAPFYGVADVIVRTTHVAQADGYSKPYVRAVAYGSAFYGFLAVLLSIRAARSLFGTSGTLLAGLAVWLGTPLLFYMYIAPPFAHACSAFAVAWFVTVWLYARRTWSMPRLAALGLSGALMAMVREQDVFFALGPTIDCFLSLFTPPAGTGQDAGRQRRQAAGQERRAARLTLAGLVGAGSLAVGLLPQLMAYNALNGRPGPSQFVTRKMLWHAPHALKVLASPEHGFFVWTPLAIFAVAGLAILAIRHGGDSRRVALIVLVMFGLQVYVNGSVDSWSAAGAFGHRRFVAVTILLVIGLAALWQQASAMAIRFQGAGSGTVVHRVLDGRVLTSRQLLVAAAIAVCVWWNLALIALFGTGMMDRQRIELGRNARDAFVTLPLRAPGLVYRYAFNRESFFRSPPPDSP